MVKLPFRRQQPEEYLPEEFQEQAQSELPVEPQPITDVPEEVKEYYESSSRERVGIAWLLGLGTLLVTVILALGLFFGGRWAYRKVTKPDQKPTPVAQTNKPQDDQNKNKNNSGSSSSNNSSNNSGQSNQGSSKPATPKPAPAPTPAPSTPSTPNPTPPASGQTPNTGPGNVVAIFVVSSVAGAVCYQIVLRKKYQTQ